MYQADKQISIFYYRIWVKIGRQNREIIANKYK